MSTKYVIYNHVLDQGMHRDFWWDPTIISTRSHGACRSCGKSDRVKYGHVETQERLVVVLGCVHCKERWIWSM